MGPSSNPSASKVSQPTCISPVQHGLIFLPQLALSAPTLSTPFPQSAYPSTLQSPRQWLYPPCSRLHPQDLAWYTVSPQ